MIVVEMADVEWTLYHATFHGQKTKNAETYQSKILHHLQLWCLSMHLLVAVLKLLEILRAFLCQIGLETCEEVQKAKIKNSDS